MQRIIQYCVIFFYFVVSIQLSANVHFCKGKFKSVTIIGFTAKKKCCKSPKMKKGCCKDVELSLKKQGTDFKSKDKIAFKTQAITLAVSPNYNTGDYSFFYSPEFKEKKLIYPPPPLPSYSKIYILHRVLRI